MDFTRWSAASPSRMTWTAATVLKSVISAINSAASVACATCHGSSVVVFAVSLKNTRTSQRLFGGTLSKAEA